MHIRSILVSVAALVVSTAAFADTTEKDIMVRPGHPVVVTTVQQAKGNSNSTTWVIVSDNGKLAAVDVEFGTQAHTSLTIKQVGRHHILLECHNHLANLSSCTITTTP